MQNKRLLKTLVLGLNKPPLLCRIDADYVIKVGDFGLSRDIYCRNYYQGGRGEKAPARWMPIEALVDGLWTEKSDVVRD